MWTPWRWCPRLYVRQGEHALAAAERSGASQTELDVSHNKIADLSAMARVVYSLTALLHLRAHVRSFASCAFNARHALSDACQDNPIARDDQYKYTMLQNKRCGADCTANGAA
jgi:hypothetical protein